MLNSITGTITHKGNSSFFLENNGIEWDIAASSKTIMQLPSPGNSVRVLTYLHLREDNISIFGFADKKERLLFLEGIPIVSELSNIHIGSDVIKQLEYDRVSEMAAIKAYNDAIALAGEVRDYATREVLDKILQDEDRHMDGIEELQGQIEHMTLPIFLTTKVV